MTTCGDELCTRTLSNAHIVVLVGGHVKDRHDGSDRFYVIHNGRAGVQTCDGRERRL